MHKPLKYTSRRRKDPLGGYIPNPVYRKAVWWFSDFISSVVVLSMLLLLIYLSVTKKIIKELGYTHPITIIFFFAVIILALSNIYYKDNNLLKHKYLKLCSYLGIKTTKRSGRIIFGIIGNGTIKVASYIEHNFFTFLMGPFIGYVNPQTIRKVAYPDYMNETSQVNLFCLMASPFNIKLAVKTDKNTIKKIRTECQEINFVVSKYVQNNHYYNWKITLTNECLILQIIGGAWQGDLFARNIKIGLDMFKTLVTELKGKYSMKDWRDFEIYWDNRTWRFYIESKLKK